jgi:hypothetical protein
MNLTDKIEEINRLCKFEWTLTVNGHRALFTGIYEYNYPHFDEDKGIIEPDLIKEILEKDNCISLCLYPSNSVACFFIYHHNLDAALDAALECLKKEL